MFGKWWSWRALGLPLALAGAVMIAAPAAAAGQDAGAAEAPDEAENPIEWHFRPASVAEPATAVSLQERWEAPFAVVSSGSPPAREPRRVVIPPAAEVARRTAAVAADSGETVAEVTVEGAGAGNGERVALAGGGAGGGAAAAAGEREAGSGAEAAAGGGATTAPEADEPGSAAARPAEAAPRRHTVVRGDTLFGIARRYGVSAASIREANRLRDDIVRLGQTLVIPPQEGSR